MPKLALLMAGAALLLAGAGCSNTPSDPQTSSLQPTATPVVEKEGPSAVSETLDAAKSEADRTTTTARAAVDYYLVIEGIAGEATARGSEGSIAIRDFGWEGQGGAREAGSGLATGFAAATDFQVTKTADKSSPMLYQSLTTGKKIKQAVLVGRTGFTSDGWDMLRVTLTDVVVTSYHLGGDLDGDGYPDEAVSFNFGKIEVEYTEQKPDGTSGATIKATWDVKANTAR